MPAFLFMLALQAHAVEAQTCSADKPCPPMVAAKPPAAANTRPDFTPSDEWRQKASALLASHVTYPVEAIEKEEEGTVRLAIRVRPDGTIVSASLVQSSDSTILDNAAFGVVRATGALPPLDPGAGAETKWCFP